MKKLSARIPWESGNEKDHATVDAEIKGPELVVSDIANQIRHLLQYEYGADVQISRGETQ